MFSHTISSGSDLAIFVWVISKDKAPIGAGVTWNGVAMTVVDAQDGVNAGEPRIEFWKLVNPTPARTNAVISIIDTTNIIGDALPFSGAHQTTPLGMAAKTTFINPNGSAVRGVVSSAADAIVMDGIASSAGAGSSITVGAGQTQRFATLAANGVG